MRDNITYYHISAKSLTRRDFGKKDDTIEPVSERQEEKSEVCKKIEQKELTEAKANNMYQIWGDNFVSDSLH